MERELPVLSVAIWEVVYGDAGVVYGGGVLVLEVDIELPGPVTALGCGSPHGLMYSTLCMC